MPKLYFLRVTVSYILSAIKHNLIIVSLAHCKAYYPSSSSYTFSSSPFLLIHFARSFLIILKHPLFLLWRYSPIQVMIFSTHTKQIPVPVTF